MARTPAHWLAKSEPDVYPWQRLVEDRRTAWDGVRNFQARNNLRAMAKGDLVLFYHSVEEKAVVGIAKVVREAYPDPTAEDGDWSAVDVAPVKALAKPVTLADMKADPKLAGLALLKQSRLSVVPVSAEHFERIVKLGQTKI
jgi:predicted RNA-binding protein with PUA-like domain